jgi:uncharacterized membrane protein (DUF4010 family)
MKDGQIDPGVTTEVAMLLMFVVGAVLIAGYRPIAIAIGGATAVLLQFKGQLHGISDRLGDDDLKAIMQFALLSLVILPVLPNQAYGPYAVLNPRSIWWMVVLIVGIGLGGYIAYRFFGDRVGAILGGVLGGLISSTATTATYSRRTAGTPESCRLAATVIMISSTIVFGRVMLEISVVSLNLLMAAALPLAMMIVVFAGLSARLWFWGRSETLEMPPQENPSELKPALLFGALYAVVLLAVAAAESRFGGKGLYVVAALSGLTDVDAATLSMSQLVEAGRIDANSAWRLVFVATISNLLFKAAIVAGLGHRKLFFVIAPLYAVAIAAAVLVLVLWPNLA